MNVIVSRESEEESFDWFKSYKDVADILRALIPDKNAKILMLGCGNSKLSEEVRRLLYTHLLHPQIVYINSDVRRWVSEYCQHRCAFLM